MNKKEMAEKVLDDIQKLSYEQFMKKYEPNNKIALNDSVKRKWHNKMKRDLKLIKMLPKAMYAQVVLHMTMDKEFSKYCEGIKNG